MAPAQLSVIFFMQLFAIVAVSRIVGWLAKRFLGQPPVVGEMIAGVLLGPSLLGLLAPEWQAMLFPKETRGLLYAVAQLGVGLYMFIVGLGFRADHFRSNARSASAVSLSGMIAPFVLAIGIAPWLRSIPGLFGPTVTATQAILFTGACIAITAFPMLARIIHERGLSNTPLGTLSLSSGAIDDAGAWTVLAVVLATFGDGAGVAIRAIGGATVFALVVLGLGPRLLRPLGERADRAGRIGQNETGIALMLFLLAAFAMDAVGMHAVFGGFLLGAVMPRGVLAEGLKRQLEPLTVLLLLPCFFTFSGLNTQLGLVADPALLGVTLVVLAASMLAKGGACWAAARLTGQDNATAMGVGALMNARGLMELIIINIGLARGIIGPALFSMLVLMAIATTLMASPLFELAYGRRARARGELGTIDHDDGAARLERAAG
ncbi:cation:proton antiporter [uncultured Sphingomonas sp.]|uniref:cation:proton antiporter n=1 Tax=uncultured Sphingomonas sp. TaxID=158754 RepID=UPI0025EBCABB|nr:cation:proton antiporter [uncultured Sphingomonas sp.]